MTFATTSTTTTTTKAIMNRLIVTGKKSTFRILCKVSVRYIVRKQNSRQFFFYRVILFIHILFGLSLSFCFFLLNRFCAFILYCQLYHLCSLSCVFDGHHAVYFYNFVVDIFYFCYTYFSSLHFRSTCLHNTSISSISSL